MSKIGPKRLRGLAAEGKAVALRAMGMGTRRGNRLLVAAALSVVSMMVAWPTYGQVSTEDIAALRAQGQQEGWTFEVGPNAATQRPIEQLCGFAAPADWKSTAVFDSTPPALAALPASYDWRTLNGCPPVRDQGGCGSCWAFGTVGALECSIKIKDGINVDLSEQWLVSCNSDGWSCSGGFWAHDYHQWKTDSCGGTGAVLETAFPYTATNAACHCPYPHDYRITSWAYIGTSSSIPSVAAIKQAILDYGPVSVSVYVDSAFQAYTSGVFNGAGNGTTNHAVVLVGWDDTQGPSGVWFLRNSWGPSWGESGYMRIAYNCASVGYAACYVNYPGSDDLRVAPGDDLNSSGKPGGPFAPASKTYTLTNTGAAAVDWTAGATQAWVDLSATSGTLAAGTTTTVDVRINATANTLAGGLYSDTVTFSNTTSGVSQARHANLSVEAPASGLPFSETFESGVLQPYWKVSGTNHYRTQITTANGPHGGTHHLTMDCSGDTTTYARNELTLCIDLARYQNVVLSFWAVSYSDDPHGPPASPFIGGADFDGVAISADGQTWYEVRGLRDLTASYAQYSIDLDAAASAHGLAYNCTFKIRFNQYDNYAIATDGIGIDDIQITGVVADDLAVSPASGLSSSGYQGGPFTPTHTTYTLTNNGAAALNWTVGATQPWLDAAPSSGSLAAGASVSVDVALNANANGLTAGSYAATVTFTNGTSGVTRTRPVTLAIDGPCLAPPPPANPDPADGATDVPVNTDLSWNVTTMGAGTTVFGVLENTYSTKDDMVLARINTIPNLSASILTWATVAGSTGAALRASYDVIYLSVDLGTTDYNNLRAAVAAGHALDEFTSLGGVLVLNVAGNQGNQLDIAPGGCDYDRTTTHNAETFASATHPYITGTEFGGTLLTLAMFNSWGSTDHGNLQNLPANATNILLNSNGVSMAEYPWGTGTVIVSTVTFGWTTATTFSGPPLDNELRYAAHRTSGCHTTYDVYFGVDNPPTTQIANDLPGATCPSGTLAYNKTYYWQVMAKTEAGSTPGPVWSFSTATCVPPPAPANPDPVDGATNVPVSTTLGWNSPIAATPSAEVPAGFVMRDGQLVKGPAEAATVVDAPDNGGYQGPPAGSILINFDDRTTPCGFADTVRASNEYAGLGVTFVGPSGKDGAAIVNECGNWTITGQSHPSFLGINPNSTLSDGGKPQGPETLQFNPAVSFVQVLAGSSSSAGQTVTLDAYDSGGALVDSKSIVLAPALAPVAVSGTGIVQVVVHSASAAKFVMDDLAFVANGATCQTTYDVYLDAANPPATKIASDLTAPTCNPGTLAHNKTYYWKVVAKTEAGPTEGPVWQFRTQGCPPPPVPASPNPADRATGVAVNSTLKWGLGAFLAGPDSGPQDGFGPQNPDPIAGPEGPSPDGESVPADPSDALPVDGNAFVDANGDCYSFGGTSETFSGSARMRADVITVSSAQILSEIQIGLSFTGSVNLYFYVFEASVRTGPYTPVFQKIVPTAGTGQALYSSGTISVALQPGKFYGIGAAWQSATVSYYRNSASFPSTWARGTIEGCLAPNVAPPFTTPISDFYTTSGLYQVGMCFGGISPCPSTYDVYFGTDNPPVARIAGDLATATCDPGPLTANTTYYWKVVAKNVDAQTEGPVWSFTTEAPPVALAGKVSCQDDTPASVVLQATDDGAPKPPGALTHIITSLPGHGALRDPGAGSITAVPYTLVNRGNTVVLTGASGYTGSDSFTFKATDGGTAPSGGDSNTATVSITAATVLYAADMNSDPAWTLDPGWAWGIPTGGGSHNLDPKSGHTGTSVIGYNLGGDYENDLAVPRYATTPAIGCSGCGSVKVTFYRWLGVESSYFDRAGIQVSNNGTVWTDVWANSIASIADSSWQYQEFDISAVAGCKPAVYIRWSVGPTDDSVSYPGWNIDDVKVIGLASSAKAGDINGDGHVDAMDLLCLAGSWSKHAGAPGYDARCDLNGDSAVDVVDLLTLADSWGT